MSCTHIPFNESSVIIIYHLLAISNGLVTCLVSVLYYHLPVDSDNQYRSAGVLHFSIFPFSLFLFLFLTKTVIFILCICITEISLLRDFFKKKLHYGLLLLLISDTYGSAVVYYFFKINLRNTHSNGCQCTFNLIL